jgi:hypothetical protein
MCGGAVASVGTCAIVVDSRSKYPPAEPEALWVAAPSKGADRDPKSKSPSPNGTRGDVN